MTPTSRPLSWLDDLIIGLTYWYFTSLVVLLAILLGYDFVKPPAWIAAKARGSELGTAGIKLRASMPR